MTDFSDLLVGQKLVRHMVPAQQHLLGEDLLNPRLKMLAESPSMRQQLLMGQLRRRDAKIQIIITRMA
jgi:hypothetical protein